MKLDVFAPLDDRARALHRAEYRRFLQERNGRFDPRTGTFERRAARMEQFLTATPAAKASETIDQVTFDGQYAHFDPRRPMSGVLLLLLAIVKLDVSPAKPCADGLGQLVLAEEVCDLCILNSSTRLFGLDPPGMRRVGLTARAVFSVPHAPRSIERPLQFARRVLDVLSLLELLRVSSDVLRGKPHLLEPIEERLLEVLVDRTGHVSFSRAELGPAEMAFAKALVPTLTLALLGERREMLALGAFSLLPSLEVIRFQWSRLLPETVRRQAFIA